MNQPPFKLDGESATVVLEALKEVCSHRSWNVLAAHVPTDHVHVIVEAETPPEKVRTISKAM